MVALVLGHTMKTSSKTVTKKELIDRIADQTSDKRVVVKRVIQQFLDEIIKELGHGNRLEFRDFGVFETKERAARVAQNPKTLEPVTVPAKRTVKFKIGRLMKLQMQNGMDTAHADAARATTTPTVSRGSTGITSDEAQSAPQTIRLG
jgi:integration host factor subunit beta